MASKDTPQSARKSTEQFITEPRFAKAHTDKRFNKISKKDRTVHLDSRFKHIVKDRKYAIAGQKDVRGRKGDVVSRAKIDRQTKGLLENFHVDSESGGSEAEEDEKQSGGSVTSGSEHARQPKTQAAQTPKASKRGARESPSRASGKFLVEDGQASSEDEEEEHAEHSDAEHSDAEAEYWARKARGELESESGSDAGSGLSDEFSSDSELDAYEAEANAYEEGVLQQELAFGEETRRIAVVNCDWERLHAVDLLVVCSSFAPSTGLVKSVHIYPSDFGISMMEEEDRNGPAIYKSDSEDEQPRGKSGRKKPSEEQQKALDEIKLRRYELNKLRYYFAVVTCDSIATAAALYAALDNQEIEMSSNKLDLRFVPDDISFEDRTVHDVCTEIPLNYEAPNFYTTVLQKTEAKLTWDQTPKDRLAVTQAAFTHLAEIDESKFAKYIASSESEDSDDEEAQDKAPGKKGASSLPTDPNADTSKIKSKQREKYAALLMGLDTLEDDEGKDEDDFFAPKPVEGNVEFSLPTPATKKSKKPDPEEEIKRKVQEKLLQKPQRTFKSNNVRSVQPKYRPDEKLEEEDEIRLEIDVGGDVEDSGSEKRASAASGKAKSRSKDSKHSGGKGGNGMDVDEEEGEEKKEDIWAGFEEAFEKPSKASLAKMKKRKREEREQALKDDKQGRAELKLLMDKTGDTSGSDGDNSDDDSDNGASAPKRKKKASRNRERNGAPEKSDINLQDPRFGAVFQDPRFMPDPTNPNFKKTAAVQAILEARKDFRKTHESRMDDDDEPIDADLVDKRAQRKEKRGGQSSHDKREKRDSAAAPSSDKPQPTAQRKVQRGFYDLGSESKAATKEDLDDLVASVKRKAPSASSGSHGLRK